MPILRDGHELFIVGGIGGNEMKCRGLVIAGITAAIMTGHWLLPTEPHAIRAAHVALQALLILPVVLAAVWFNLSGAVVASAAVTALGKIWECWYSLDSSDPYRLCFSGCRPRAA